MLAHEAQGPMEAVHRPGASHRQQGRDPALGPLARFQAGLPHSGIIWANRRGPLLGQPGCHGGWSDEVSIGQALHQGTGTEAVGPMLGEVGLTEHKQARD